MPNLEVYVISKRLLERTLAFAKGVMQSDPKLNVKVVHKIFCRWLSKNLKGDAIATWGILRGTGVLIKEAEKTDRFFVDFIF